MGLIGCVVVAGICGNWMSAHEQRIVVGNFIGTSTLSVVHVDGDGAAALNLDIRSQADVD